MNVGDSHNTIGVSRRYLKTRHLIDDSECTEGVIWLLSRAKISSVANFFRQMSFGKPEDLAKCMAEIHSHPLLRVVPNEWNYNQDTDRIMVVWERYLTLQQAKSIFQIDQNEIAAYIEVGESSIPFYTISENAMNAMKRHEKKMWKNQCEVKRECAEFKRKREAKVGTRPYLGSAPPSSYHEEPPPPPQESECCCTTQ